MSKITELQVNGRAHKIDAQGERTLLSVLRDDLDLTGTKYGCGEGQCGACTVLIDGVPARSCKTTLESTSGKRITTIEGISTNGDLHPLQKAFLQLDAMQCSYCTSGMIVTAYAFLKKSPDPTPDEIVKAMNGNICRCGTYQRIVAAIRLGAEMIRTKGSK